MESTATVAAAATRQVVSCAGYAQCVGGQASGGGRDMWRHAAPKRNENRTLIRRSASRVEISLPQRVVGYLKMLPPSALQTAYSRCRRHFPTLCDCNLSRASCDTDSLRCTALKGCSCLFGLPRLAAPLLLAPRTPNPAACCCRCAAFISHALKSA